MRANYLDNLRGLAVLWMVIFHTSYDLHLFRFVDWDFSSGFWYGFPRVIAFTFLFCVGIALNYGHTPKIHWQALYKRSLKLGIAALTISLVTYFIFPGQWIYFGTLHCTFVGSILGALVVNRRSLAWALFIIIFSLQYLFHYNIKWVSSILQKPSMDFIPIYPWFWVILLGIVLGPYLSSISWIKRMPKIPFLDLLGRHSLKIYLIHQPLIFGLIWGLNLLRR